MSAGLGKRVAWGVSWLAGAQVLQRMSSIAITAWLARLLSPGDFGAVALALVVANLLSICRDLGISAALVQGPDPAETDLDTGFWLSLMLGFVLYGIGLSIAGPMLGDAKDPRVPSVLRALLLTIPVYTLAQVSDALLQRRLAFKRIAAIELASTVIAGVLAIGAARQGYGVWALVVQHLGFAVLMSIGRVFGAGWMPRMNFDRAVARRQLGFGSGIIGGAVAGYAMRNVDNAVVGARLGTTALGYYSLAYNLMLLPSYAITGIVGRVVFPALASIKHDAARLRRAYYRALRLSASLTVPLVVGLALTAPEVILLLYGDQWAQSATLLSILCVAGVFEALNIWGVIFYTMGRPAMMFFWFALASMVLGVAFLLAAPYGVVAIAWTYAGLAPLVIGGPHVIANRLIGLPMKDFARALLPAAVSTAVMVLALLALRSIIPPLGTAVRLAVLVLAGGVVYVTIYCGIGLVSAGPRRLVAWLWGTESPATSSDPLGAR